MDLQLSDEQCMKEKKRQEPPEDEEFNMFKSYHVAYVAHQDIHTILICGLFFDDR